MARNLVQDGVPPLDICGVRFNRQEREDLHRLARSEDVSDRRLCVDYIETGTMVRGNLHFFLGILDQLIPDRSERVRWGALSVLGEYAESNPAAIWPLVVKWGSSESKDIRSGIACCVLEHILECHCSSFLARIKAIIEEGNRRFGGTLSQCWKLGQAEHPENAQALDSLVRGVGLRE